MSSRQEEKQQRKAERLALEAAQARKESRKRRLRVLLTGFGVLATIAIIAVAVLAKSAQNDAGPKTASKVAIPPQQESNLKVAAKKANCQLTSWPDEGNTHTTDASKWIYKTNPPTSGPHNPSPAQDGIYAQGNEPAVGLTVHSLEHGRIDIQYKAGTPKATVAKLETLGLEQLQFDSEGYHTLVFQNNTKMKAAVAATAWRQSLTCNTVNDGVYDAIRDFRTKYTNKGPEMVP